MMTNQYMNARYSSSSKRNMLNYNSLDSTHVPY